MQMLILAFPEQPINLTVMSDIDLANEDDRQIAKEQCWHGDLLNVITSMRDKYSVNDILVCGPWDYIVGLVEQIQKHFEDDKTLQVMPMPTGDKIELPANIRQRTESGLII